MTLSHGKKDIPTRLPFEIFIWFQKNFIEEVGQKLAPPTATLSTNVFHIVTRNLIQRSRRSIISKPLELIC